MVLRWEKLCEKQTWEKDKGHGLVQVVFEMPRVYISSDFRGEVQEGHG